MSRRKIWAVVGGMCLAAACDKPVPQEVLVPHHLRVTPESLLFDAIGDTIRVRATVVDEQDRPVSGSFRITWSSAGPGAQVDSTGLVRSAAAGPVSVIAASGRFSGTAVGQVVQAPVTLTVTPPLDSVITHSGGVPFAARVRDRLGADITNATVTWQSSNDSVARVTNGFATAQGSGMATIIASAGPARGEARLMVSLPPTYLRVTAPPRALEGDTASGVTVRVLDRMERPVVRDALVRLTGRHLNGDSTTVVATSSGPVARFDRVPFPIPGVSRLTAVTAGLTYSDTARVDVHLRFRQLGSGSDHVCGLNTSGRAYCWGSNLLGQLGDGTLVDRLAPTPVATAERFDQVGINNGGGCGRIAGRGLRCWGVRYQNGQPVPGPFVDPGLPPATLVQHSQWPCAIDAAGRAHCWNAIGVWFENAQQLAGEYMDVSPAPIMVSRQTAWIDAAVGVIFACAVDAAGVAWCTGNNDHGQQGVGAVDAGVPHPRQVNSTLRFRAIGAGWWYACGLTTSEGVACWGANNWLQVHPDSSRKVIATPSVVAGLPPIKKLALTFNMPCALDTQGSAWCWGIYAGGPARAVPWNTSFRDLVASRVNVCGIAVDGYTWCGFPYGQPSRVPPPERP